MRIHITNHKLVYDSLLSIVSIPGHHGVSYFILFLPDGITSKPAKPDPFSLAPSHTLALRPSLRWKKNDVQIRYFLYTRANCEVKAVRERGGRAGWQGGEHCSDLLLPE